MFLNGVGELLLRGSFLTLTCDAHKGHDCQYAIVAMTDVQVGAMYPVYHQQSDTICRSLSAYCQLSGQSETHGFRSVTGWSACRTLWLRGAPLGGSRYDG